MEPFSRETDYQCWLCYEETQDKQLNSEYKKRCGKIVLCGAEPVLAAAGEELVYGLENLLGLNPVVSGVPQKNKLYFPW